MAANSPSAPPLLKTQTTTGERVLATPAFLSALRPPPLPLWALPHATTALTVSRLSLLVTRSTASIGFSIARTSTSLGFSVARTLLGPLLTGVGAVLDNSLGCQGVTGGGFGGGLLATGSAVALDGIEQLALLGIDVGSGVTNAVLGSASSTIALLESVYGNDEALRALEAFLQLVQKEWTTSLESDPYEEGGLSRWTTVEVGKAAATWAALQSVTGKMEGRRIASELEELDVKEWGRGRAREEGEVFWEVTEEELLQSGEEVIQATIPTTAEDVVEGAAEWTEDEQTREHLRRFSRMCLGSYAGLGVLFFGIKLPSPSFPSSTSADLTSSALSNALREKEEEALAGRLGPHPSSAASPPADEAASLGVRLGALDSGWAAPELRIESTGEDSEATSELDATEDYGLHAGEERRGWGLWGLLTGSLDNAVLHSLGGVDADSITPHAQDSSDDENDDDDCVSLRTHTENLRKREEARKRDREVRKRKELKGRRPPKFFVVTDHPNQSILLILRGTSSLDDIATDLACEPTAFDSKLYWDDAPPLPSPSPTVSAPSSSSTYYWVHGGMFEMALAMGGRDSPVTRAVARALRRNPGYSLYLAGHSLGAGVASLLGLIWANPETSLTSSKSGLPTGRKIKIYGFATPCVTDAELSSRCKNLIHSFIYSFDAVSRFSLGHIKDIRSAAAWLCFANENPEESCTNILSRIISYQRGNLDDDPAAKLDAEALFTSFRSTLEANQHYATLFPPGEILWLVRPDDLQLPNDRPDAQKADPRLFKVTGRTDVVFKQMIFSRTMLSSHLPHEYTQAMDQYL